jgi:hypothetical protein
MAKQTNNLGQSNGLESVDLEMQLPACQNECRSQDLPDTL